MSCTLWCKKRGTWGGGGTRLGWRYPPYLTPALTVPSEFWSEEGWLCCKGEAAQASQFRAEVKTEPVFLSSWLVGIGYQQSRHFQNMWLLVSQTQGEPHSLGFKFIHSTPLNGCAIHRQYQGLVRGNYACFEYSGACRQPPSDPPVGTVVHVANPPLTLPWGQWCMSPTPL